MASNKFFPAVCLFAVALMSWTTVSERRPSPPQPSSPGPLPDQPGRGWGRDAVGPSRDGGRYGIRTHGDPEATTAFEAAPFVRSGNLPPARLAVHPRPATTSLVRSAPLVGEEVAEHLGALVGPRAGGDLELVVEPGVGSDVVQRAERTSLHVDRAVDDTGDPSLL